MVRKHVSIKLVGDAREEYLALQRVVQEELAKGATSSFHQTLLRSIDSKIALLKTSYDHGIQIPRKHFPRKYLQAYEVTNLWKVDLAGYWRMIYTLRQPQREEIDIDVISVWLDVLNIVDHKRYDKLFGYRKA